MLGAMEHSHRPSDRERDWTNGAGRDVWHALLRARELPRLALELQALAAQVPGVGRLWLSWGSDAGGYRHAPDAEPMPAPLAEGCRHSLAEPADQPLAVDGGWVRAAKVAATDRSVAVVVATPDDAPAPVELMDTALALASTLVEKESLRWSIARTEQAERLQGALYAIAELAASDIDMPSMLAALHEIVGGLMYAENFYIVRYSAARHALRFIYFADELDPFIPDPGVEIAAEEMPNSLTLGMIRHGRALMGPSLQLRSQLGLKPAEAQGPDSVDWLGVPLLSGEEVRGAVVVQSYDGQVTYTEEDRVLLSFVAQHILTALERRDARDELERRVAERTRELARINAELRGEVEERQRGERLQAALFRIAELSITTETQEAFYAAVHEVVGRLLYARNFFIALVDDSGDGLEFPYSVDERDAQRPPRRLAHGLTEYVLRTRRPLLATHRKVTELVASGEVRSSGAASRCWLGVPLLRDDAAVGVVVVQSYSDAVMFTRRDQELLTFVSFHIASGLMRKRAQERLLEAYAELEQRVEERTDALARANAQLRAQIGERERAEQKLTHLALHDSLTGLPNRTQFLDRLQAAMATYGGGVGSAFAVLFIDLDRFKVVNDSVGHLVGDQLLKHAARRISLVVREPDLVARLGGDEFAVLLEDVGTEAGALEVGQRIIEALSAPMHIEGKELFTSASIGIALANAEYGAAEELLRDADAAMYRAKAAGRNTSETFDAGLRLEALRVLDLEGELRRSIQRGDFEPFFQPIVELEHGRVVGHEALLRWHHPTRGLMAPGEFLTVAQDSGLIEQIDWQIFEQAIAAIPSLCPDLGYVCINLSPRHLHNRQLVPRIGEMLGRSGVDGGRLRIELTEGALLEASSDVRRSLDGLRALGVMAQLDDFGTGYSALSYLHRFPIGALKIDRSFVADIEAEIAVSGRGAVVEAIMAMAQSLQLEVIAEGVETEGQRQLLAGLGCRFGQGWLFGQPEPLPSTSST